MTKPETQIDYGRRIARVADHIAEHLDDALDVERLAAVANFSPYHFHRIYREATGETVADTVRRLRLHRAAVDLIRSETPLLRIARRTGYGTLAAFSRAFAIDYGVPPGAYRLRGKLLPPGLSRHRERTQMYRVTVEPFAPVRLAVMKHEGDYQEIGHTFDRLLTWTVARRLFGPSARPIGIYYDDPESVPLRDLRSEAGLTVDASVGAEPDVRIQEIPPLLCASVVHQGPYAELERPYRYLFREWLPASGRDPDDHPCFEEYLNNPRELPPTEWLTRIYIPVKP